MLLVAGGVVGRGGHYGRRLHGRVRPRGSEPARHSIGQPRTSH